MNYVEVPRHVAIIMDGNGRWAKKKGLRRREGHLEGSKTLEKLALYAADKNIKCLSVYAFSTDNFKRSADEVNFLMDLFVKIFKTKLNKVIEAGVKIVFSGSEDNLPEEVIEAMKIICDKTKNNDKTILNVCLNYGGQEEIVEAAKKVAELYKNGKLNLEELDKVNFERYLYQDLPPIDLLIRTSGEMRVSNFMLYQMSYAEFYFTNVCFPDFDEREFDKALDDYANRDRKFGKVKERE